MPEMCDYPSPIAHGEGLQLCAFGYNLLRLNVC